MDELKTVDSEIFGLIEKEKIRQSEGIELIPSENYISTAVQTAMGSILNNKYSEGYPGKRYYGGQENIDKIENIAIERAKQIFNTDYHCNVQPYSGSPANLAVYVALLNFGDTVMGMDLSCGGHLTHGSPVNFTGKSYNFIGYGVRKDTGQIDYDEVRKLALKHKPRMIVSGATAYPRELDFEAFSEIAKEVGAISMADIAHVAGLIVGGVHKTPFFSTDAVTSTTHKTLRGPRAGIIFCKEEFAKPIDKAVFPGLQGGPHDHIIAGKAVCFKEASTPSFKEYAEQVVKNAKVLAEELMNFGFKLVTDGTDNHLILIDLRVNNITGKIAEEALDKIGLTVNKNVIPYDPWPPLDPSGIRLGSPAATTRGMKEEEMKQIAKFINQAIENYNNDEKLGDLKNQVKLLCANFPVSGIELNV